MDITSWKGQKDTIHAKLKRDLEFFLFFKRAKKIIFIFVDWSLNFHVVILFNLAIYCQIDSKFSSCIIFYKKLLYLFFTSTYTYLMFKIPNLCNNNIIFI